MLSHIHCLPPNYYPCPPRLSRDSSASHHQRPPLLPQRSLIRLTTPAILLIPLPQRLPAHRLLPPLAPNAPKHLLRVRLVPGDANVLITRSTTLHYQPPDLFAPPVLVR